MAIGEWNTRDILPKVGRRIEVDRLPSNPSGLMVGVITHHLTNDDKRRVFRPDDCTNLNPDYGWYIGVNYPNSASMWRYIDLPDSPEVTSYEVTVTYTKENKNMHLAPAVLRVKDGHVPVVYEADSDGDFDAAESVIIWQGDLTNPFTTTKDDDGKVLVTSEGAAFEAARSVISTFYATGIEAAAKTALK